MSITYRTRRGNDIVLDILKINVQGNSYYMLFNMFYDKENEDRSRISVLMDFYSTAQLIYGNASFEFLPFIFKKITEMYNKKKGKEFKPGWRKLYHETCGHMNLFVENKTSRTAITMGIGLFRRMNREQMLDSAEIADVGFVDDNSIAFNETSVKRGTERITYWESKLEKANLKKSLHFGKADYELSLSKNDKFL